MSTSINTPSEDSNNNQLPALKVNAETVALFSKYLGKEMSAEMVQAKGEIIRIKGTAFKPYLCVREGLFLHPRMGSHPCYNEVLKFMEVEER